MTRKNLCYHSTFPARCPASSPARPPTLTSVLIPKPGLWTQLCLQRRLTIPSPHTNLYREGHNPGSTLTQRRSANLSSIFIKRGESVYHSHYTLISARHFSKCGQDREIWATWYSKVGSKCLYIGALRFQCSFTDSLFCFASALIISLDEESVLIENLWVKEVESKGIRNILYH